MCFEPVRPLKAALCAVVALHLQSGGFFLPPSAAMLCPALLCAALLLLTPVEITDARALQQPSDAAQVGWGGQDGRGGGVEKEKGR